MALENVCKFEERVNGDEALEYVAQNSSNEDFTADEARVAAGGIDVGCVIVGFGGTTTDTYDPYSYSKYMGRTHALG